MRRVCETEELEVSDLKGCPGWGKSSDALEGAWGRKFVKRGE